MVYLKPDAERTENGVPVREKIIPWGARWPKDAAGFRKGDPFKADLLLSGGTGKVRGVTIHNTGRIRVSPETTPAEQYTRATWPNANMNSVRVHYYVDACGAWQNLREDEVGWHTGDGTFGPGNNTTVALELIMDGSGDAEDRAAEENGARLAASILRRHGLTERDLFTHRELSPVRKYCPVYLLPRWEEFRAKVGRYLDGLKSGEPEAEPGRLTGVQEPSRAAADGDPETPSGPDEDVRGDGSSGTEAAPEPDGPSSGLYRVQTGAFRCRENAERLAERLTAQGYPAFVRWDSE